MKNGNVRRRGRRKGTGRVKSIENVEGEGEGDSRKRELKAKKEEGKERVEKK
jgi:hypothetical protein